MSDPVPDEISSYQILEVLARSPAGVVVYRARHRGLNREVALKAIFGSYDNSARTRALVYEARSVAALRHPNIIEVYEVSECEGGVYLAMEFVDGGGVADKLHGRPWPVWGAVRVVEGVARALHAVHQAGFVHRDVTPAHVLVQRNGHPKLAGFGQARPLDGPPPKSVVGTPRYLAPEQIACQAVSPATDIHAAGALLYELLTGRPAYPGKTTADTLIQVTRHRPAPPHRLQPDLPRDLGTVCLRCLEKRPQDRYATAEALADDLRAVLEGGTAAATRSMPRWLGWLFRARS